jgi:hypothetical protein
MINYPLNNSTALATFVSLLVSSARIFSLTACWLLRANCHNNIKKREMIHLLGKGWLQHQV